MNDNYGNFVCDSGFGFNSPCSTLLRFYRWVEDGECCCFCENHLDPNYKFVNLDLHRWVEIPCEEYVIWKILSQ
jgi:hypothetical protein